MYSLVYTIDFTVFTKGASLSYVENGLKPKVIGNSTYPLDEFLVFAQNHKKPTQVMIKSFSGDQKADLIEIQLKSRGFNVNHIKVGGKK